MGLKRVVLARELSFDEIKEIKKNTNIELEVFIHGALCVSYSGQCYLSCYIGNRSANRGECAQACRKKYSLLDDKGNYLIKNQYLLSLKDNNLSKHVENLAKLGISSFKIEGRLKDENYVKNVVLYYHKLLQNFPRTSFGKITEDFEPNIEKTFNRGYTDDYIKGKKDNIYNFLTPKSIGESLGKIENVYDDCFTLKTSKKINPQDGLFFVLNNNSFGCLVNKVQKTNFGYKIYPNKKIKLQKGQEVRRNIDNEFTKILQNSKTTRKLEVKFTISKEKIELIDERSNKVKFDLTGEIAQNVIKIKENYKKAFLKSSDSCFCANEVELIGDEFIFLPVSKMNEIRRTMFEELKNLILSRYKTKQQKPLNIAKYPKNEGNYQLNVHNSKAKEFYELCDCKVKECSFENKMPKSAYLMTTKHCLRRCLLNCSDKRKLFLEDEKQTLYPLEFDCEKCVMKIAKP